MMLVAVTDDGGNDVDDGGACYALSADGALS
jgi:hypothetical protein